MNPTTLTGYTLWRRQRGSRTWEPVATAPTEFACLAKATGSGDFRAELSGVDPNPRQQGGGSGDRAAGVK